MTTHTNRQRSGPPANERTPSMSIDADNAARLLLTIEEAADRLGIGRTLMYALVKDGQVESVHIGRLRRIPADALPRYLQRLRTVTQPNNSAA